VADKEDRTLEVLEHILDDLAGRDVQVVGGLVEQEPIGVLKQERRQVRPRPLPAAQGGERPVPHVARKGQARQDLLDALGVGVAAAGLEVGLHGPVSRQEVGAAAAGGVEQAGDDLQERGLAGAVGADEADAVAAAQVERDARQDVLVRVAVRDVFADDERHK
jgi:hypothetical protein